MSHQAHWLYLDLNSFFSSCEQQENPELRHSPLAIVPMLADSTFCIAASYSAKAFGVKTGVRVGDAKKMCPGLKFMVARHDVYVRYHHRVIEAVESCVPVHSVCSIDEVACELTGSQKDLTKARALALKIKLALREQVGAYMTASIGIGPNALLAKMASDMQKPDGLTVITASELPQRLHELKLQDIPGVGRKMEARIQVQGVHSVEALLKLNESQMRGLWGGILGARMYRLLRGEDLSTPAYFHGSNTPQSIGHEHVLPPVQRNLNDSLGVAQRLLVKVAVRLRQARMMARSMKLLIKTLDGLNHERRISFDETQDTSFLMRELKKIHSELAIKKPLKIGVTLGNFIPENEHQLSLFNDEKKNKIFQVVDSLNSKYGRDTVYLGAQHDFRTSAPTRIAFSRIPGLDEV